MNVFRNWRKWFISKPKKVFKRNTIFPYKTLMIFSNNFESLKEKDNTFKKESEAKYQFDCKKMKKKLF